MSDPPPILAYAAPDYRSAEEMANAEFELTFERPSIALDQALRIGVMVVVFLGTFLIPAFAWDRYNSHRGIDGGAGFALFVFILIEGWCIWWPVRSFFRIARLGNTPVTIALTADHIVITDPLNLGPEPRALRLGDARRCHFMSDLLLFPPMRVYRIMIDMHSFFAGVTLSVRSPDRAVVRHAVADIQRAIELHASRR